MTVDPSAPQPRKASVAPWLLGGCGCLLFIIGAAALGGFLFFKGVKAATAAPEKAITEFLAAAAAGDADKAHDYFAAPLKEAQPLDQFREVVRSNSQLFDVVDTTFNERSIDNAKATFKGTVTLKSGTEMPAEFTLVEENGAWKLISYHIGSTE